MSEAEQIFRSAVASILLQGTGIIRRVNCRRLLQVDEEQWNSSYNPTFQGMREDQPGGAPAVAQRYRNVFRQVGHGEHTLTAYGQQLARELLGSPAGL